MTRPLDKGKRGWRVGSSMGRGPVWAEWPIKMHRPLPEGARIKVVTVSKRVDGPRVDHSRAEGEVSRAGCAWERWTAEITLDVKACAKRKGGIGSVGVDLGWRQFPDRFRAAAWSGEDGGAGELVLEDAFRDLDTTDPDQRNGKGSETPSRSRRHVPTWQGQRDRLRSTAVEAATGDQVARVARRLRDLDDTAKTAASEDAARAFGDLDA